MNLHLVFSTGTIAGGPVEHNATPEDDYVTVSKTIIFQSNIDSVTENIQILDDNEPEVREFFQIGLSNANCGIDRGDAIVIGIVDNDGKFAIYL